MFSVESFLWGCHLKKNNSLHGGSCLVNMSTEGYPEQWKPQEHPGSWIGRLRNGTEQKQEGQSLLQDTGGDQNLMEPRKQMGSQLKCFLVSRILKSLLVLFLQTDFFKWRNSLCLQKYQNTSTPDKRVQRNSKHLLFHYCWTAVTFKDG